jgi:hypothetical protein
MPLIHSFSGSRFPSALIMRLRNKTLLFLDQDKAKAAS